MQPNILKITGKNGSAAMKNDRHDRVKYRYCSVKTKG
jgi:hypothetical protein